MSDKIPELLSVLDVFSRAPDKVSLERANSWLQDFQHSPEAWSTCDVLLSSDAPSPVKLFAAQTFRAKVTFDLHQVEPANLLSLRDTLLAALQRYVTGPRSVVTQLCLAISGLALQLPSWTDVVQTLIKMLGSNPESVPTLLLFLTLLPEEMNGNTRIPITDDEYVEREKTLLTSNSTEVLNLLAMYNQATGVTNTVQMQIFDCVRSWLVAGEMSVKNIAATPLLSFAFDAIASEELFDSAVDLICDLIHETQEIDENMPVIELIVPRVIALRPRLLTDKDDPDKIRGYARIFTEAGETYRLLLLQHTETFFPIVEAIGECSAYPDLDIVPITFPFWMRLSQVIGKRPSVSPLFQEAFRSLMTVIIRHLHFPTDAVSLNSQEAEKFRSFRHVMGDTLKDCCLVLRSDACIMVTYHMIVAALQQPAGSISWQDIEAPLFAMRSMGAEMDPKDIVAIPKIMDIIPSLPDHPRVRYAALLVISRYTEWINEHPEYLQPQLQYISSGFQSPDVEVSAAAGQALKYLCQDCKGHLVDFLPTLHTFLSTNGSSLSQDDRREVYEAIAYVISAMPMENAAESLRTFALDILAQIHTITVQATPATKQELNAICDGLENLEVMLHVIRNFGDELPTACRNTCSDMYAIFDSFLLKYGSDHGIAERTTRVLRHGVTLYGDAGLSVAASVVKRMSEAFSATGFSGYVWIAGKIISRYGNEDNADLRSSFLRFYESTTSKVVALLQEKGPGDMPDVIEDYVQMLLQLIDYAPDVFFQSSAFPLAFRATMAALTMVHSDILFASLDLFRIIFTHDCLTNTVSPPPKFPIYAAAIRGVFESEGYEFLGLLLSGLAGLFPEDSTSAVVSIFRAVASVWPQQLLTGLPTILQQLPNTSFPTEAKTQFFAEVTSAIESKQYDKVKYAIISLNRASRKAKDRRRGLD